MFRARGFAEFYKSASLHNAEILINSTAHNNLCSVELSMEVILRIPIVSRNHHSATLLALHHDFIKGIDPSLVDTSSDGLLVD